jgi:hypothetical protein
MNIATYKLHCTNCSTLDKTAWKIVLASNVTISVNLQTNDYEFLTRCPDCRKAIFNTRRAFK